MAMTKMGNVRRTEGWMKGGTLGWLSVCACIHDVRRGRGIGAGTHGGSSRLGFRSRRSSPSLGGGIRFSGGHDVMLCGVFQGTALGGELCSAVEAWRAAGILRRH